MGGGVSLNGLLCGAVSSIVLAIGLKYGRTSPEEDPRPVWDMVDRYVAQFRNALGSVICRQLTGLDLKSEEGLKECHAEFHDHRCTDRLRFAVRKAMKIFPE